jgi:condensin complex subunit 2
MSKTFDEGGAKGLLLANLGVSEASCRIVFDSSAFDESNDKDKDSEADLSITGNQEEVSSHTVLPRVPEGYMEISSLSDKLRSLLSDHCDDEWNDSNNIRSVSLVPQLSALRSEHEKLVDLGCCGPDAAIALAPTIGPKTPAGKVRQYHANSQQEGDADYSIHKEAIERSQRKLKFDGRDLNMSSDGTLFPDTDISHHRDNVTTPGFDNSSIGDYGGGYDDGDDDDDCFDAFIANVRYSEVSLVPTSNEKESAENSSNNNPSTAVAALIDAISSGSTVLAMNDYEFFSNKNINNGGANEWAGAAHWKRNNNTNKATANKSSLPAKKSKKKSSKISNQENKELSLVDFNHAIAPDLSSLLNPTTKQKKNAASSTVLSKALITKYTKDENVLPYDVGFNPNGTSSNSLHELTKFFLRPNISILQPLSQNHMNIASNKGQTVEVKKIVDFNLQTTTDWGMDENDDENNDGPGFDFGGNEDNSCDDEYLVPVLENVRKVDKVRVGFATVAKKVDVKRLKRDLWNELESHFNSKALNEQLQEIEGDHATAKIIEDKPAVVSTNELSVVSFQDTVRTLGQQQAQTDITLPFYFICILHLANEKGLRLEQTDFGDNNDTVLNEGTPITAQQRLLSDFMIHQDEMIQCDNY